MFVEALVAGILKDIADLRLAPLPPRKAESAEPDKPRRPSAPQTAARPQAAPPQRCSPADGEGDHAHRSWICSTDWANADADALSKSGRQTATSFILMAPSNAARGHRLQPPAALRPPGIPRLEAPARPDHGAMRQPGRRHCRWQMAIARRAR